MLMFAVTACDCLLRAQCAPVRQQVTYYKTKTRCYVSRNG